MDGRPEGLDHHLAIWLAVVRGADLPHLALEAVLRAREGERGAPLAGAGLGRQLLDAGLGVVVGLRHSGVRLVRAGGGDAFVLVVDLRSRPERLLQAVRTEEGRGPPQAIDVLDLLGDVDVALGRHLLEDQVHREDGGEVVGADGLTGPRVQRRRGRGGQVGEDVVPTGRHFRLIEQDLVLRDRCHGIPLIGTKRASRAHDGWPRTSSPTARRMRTPGPVRGKPASARECLSHAGG